MADRRRTLRGLGTALTVDLGNSAVDQAEFDRVWSRCAAPRATAAEPALTLSPDSGLESATQQITQALIAARAGGLLMFHAGGVAEPATGRSLVFVAPGGTGKSTLTRALAAEYGYLSDETIGIEPGSWAVQPYPKPVTLAPDGVPPKREHAPDELGLGHAPEAAHVAALVVLRRTPGRATATFTDLGVLDTIMAVTPETSSLSALPRPLHLLAELHAAVGCRLVEYGESAQVLSWCRAMLDGEVR